MFVYQTTIYLQNGGYPLLQSTTSKPQKNTLPGLFGSRVPRPRHDREGRPETGSVDFTIVPGDTTLLSRSGPLVSSRDKILRTK